ncbi:hypothetical protein Goshw_003359, partial [Gossypium schwendimanii]|nr:hypothetical protein [Gossypium schwendimanii]
MSGTQVRQAISGINDMCTMMGKASPNEYPLSEVRVENDLVDDFDGSYIPKESVVLLENGALFLLDLASCVNWLKLNAYVKKTKIEMLNPYAIVDKDQFLAFSRAKAYGFQFVLASKSLLLLCDLCKPMDSLLYSSSDNEYEFPKRFKYLNLNYLRGYLNDMTMPLKFLVAPDLPQLPPFLLGKPSCCNIKWSLKMFNEVMRVAAEMVVLDSSLLNNDETVSLTDDMDEITKVHKVTDPKYTMDSVGLKLFDDLCPIELKFDVPILNFVLIYAICLIEEWIRDPLMGSARVFDAGEQQLVSTAVVET